MPEFTSVEVELGFTQSLGDYEFLRTDVRLGANLAPGESVEDAVESVYAKVEEKLVDSAKQIHAALSKDAKKKSNIRPE